MRKHLGGSGVLPAVATPPFSGLGRISNICHALDFSLMTWKKKKKSSLKPTRDKPDSSFYPGVRQPPPSAFPTHLKFPEGTQKGQRGFSFANATGFFHSGTSPALPCGGAALPPSARRQESHLPSPFSAGMSRGVGGGGGL